MQWTFGNFSSEFHFGKEICVLLQISGGGEVAATYGVHASLFLSCFSIFQIKMEPINSHFLAILGKKELLGTSGKV